MWFVLWLLFSFILVIRAFSMPKKLISDYRRLSAENTFSEHYGQREKKKIR